MAKQRSIRVRIRRHYFTEKDFRPYATALGQLVFAWSDLHERLGFVFAALMGGKTDRNMALWNAPQFDRPKRKLLEATVLGLTPKDEAAHPGMCEGLFWLLSEADKLEDTRNNAVHSPVQLTFGKAMARHFVLYQYATPNISLRHPRAQRLLGKDLLSEYRWARDATLILRDYAVSAHAAIQGSRTSWPSKPRLPAREPRNGPRGQHRPLSLK